MLNQEIEKGNLSNSEKSQEQGSSQCTTTIQNQDKQVIKTKRVISNQEDKQNQR